MTSKSAHLLIISVIFLITMGVVMLSSTAAFSTDAYSKGTDIYVDVKRQFVWMGAGLVACIVCALLDYRWLAKLAAPGYIIVGILLVLCFVPGIGKDVNGAYRWLSGKSFGMPRLQVQPSEFAKITIIVVLAAWYAKSARRRDTFVHGLFVPLLILIPFVGLVGAEVDIGSAALLATGAIAVMFAAGIRWRYIFAGGLVAAGSVAALIATFQTSLTMQNRMARIMAFMDLEASRSGHGLQQWRALLAFGSGGVDGVGLGLGRQKMQYLPFAHTDFIFPMIGEELGLIFTLLVVFSFVLIAIAGLMIAGHAPDRFGKLLGIGIVSILVVQAILNIGVTTAVLPNKGLPLPFVSYGGSNLLCCMIGIGILLSIYRKGMSESETEHSTMMKARVTPRV